MHDRIISGAIAFSQFWLSLLLLAIGFYFLPLVPFGLWGLINSFTLLSANMGARKSALIWHILYLALIGFATARSHPLNYPLLEVWALIALPAIYYLARAVGYLGNRDS